MFSPFKKKTSPRRQAIREDRAEAARPHRWWHGDAHHMILVAMVFALVASLLQLHGSHPLPYREGQKAPMDLRAPCDFTFYDPIRLARKREEERANSPPVLVKQQERFDQISSQLHALRTTALGDVSNLSEQMRKNYPELNDQAIAAMRAMDDQTFNVALNVFMERGLNFVPLISEADRQALVEKRAGNVALAFKTPVQDNPVTPGIEMVFTVTDKGVDKEARAQIRAAAAVETNGPFAPALAELVTSCVLKLTEPTFRLDARESSRLADQRAEKGTIPGTLIFAGTVIVPRGRIIEADNYRELEQAQSRFEAITIEQDPWSPWLSRLGSFAGVLLLTIAGSMYISRVQKHFSVRRAWAVCGLLLVTLALARGVVQYAPQSLFLTGVGPTLLTAIILVIAYNQRFAMGVSALHGLLVTFTLGQGIDFYLVMLAGSAVFCFGLNEIRTRGKLIEVGAVASAIVFLCVWVLGATRLTGLVWSARTGAADVTSIWQESLWGAGSGIIVAMFALAVLPSIERIFKITTAMTLLELCDANKPLLVRLSQEAPGTFNHSLTVGIMAEAAGNAIGANGLMCRVGAYYHDVGKLSKPQYFIENQSVGQPNRHDRLSPAMSLLIIVGHVKDGIELAREYALPWVVHQFIAQHHGTTLVEYFYHAARKRAEQEGVRTGAGQLPEVSDTEFRYPGPRPLTREAAIIMICDGCESIVRSIDEPTPGRIETAVHNLIMKRLLDGQFSECDLTLRDLSIIEETLLRTLAGIHHGRVAYPARTEVESTEISTSQSA